MRTLKEFLSKSSSSICFIVLVVEGWFRRGGGGGGGVVAVLHPILWIAACSGLMECGGSKCCPIMSSCLLLVCTVSQSHLHDYQHFADLGTVMVWCGLDGGEWRSLCGSSFSQVRLTLPVAVSPDTFRWL